MEFAIVAPLLFMLVFGIIAFSLTFTRLQGMESAAREGARLASIGGTDSGPASDRRATLVDRVQQAAPAFVNPEHIEVEVNDIPVSMAEWCPAGNVGETVKVTVRIEDDHVPSYQLAIPFVGSWNPDLESFGVFVCEDA